VVDVVRYQNADPLPMVASEIYIPHAYAALGRDLQNLRVPMYTLIETRYGQRIAEVQQVISACAVPAKRARLLKVRAGSPGLAITRHYLGEDDKILLVSTSLYPAGRFSYSMSLRFSWRAAEART
jgi:DNA-binding GntR family transcriptional regulator